MSNERIVINGGKTLYGSVSVHGAKNAVLPLLAAALLTRDEVVIENCPYITDVENMIGLLRDLGADVERDGRNVSVCGRISRTQASGSLCSTMRSSMFMLGAVLSLTGEVELPMPGGCDIGARPLDIHIDGLKKMGASTEYTQGGIRCSAQKLHGADIVMRYPSVGATENLLMCASLAEGYTSLVNCAREPEIVALAKMLKSMGARISGEGTSVIRVQGVEKLSGTRFRADGDRIVAGTVVAATAACGGDVTLYGVSADDMRSVLQAFRSDVCRIEESGVAIRVRSNGHVRAKSVITAPYPLFPTDMQPQFIACQCFSGGISRVEETVFENRLGHVSQLRKMGADIAVSGDCAIVRGKQNGMIPSVLTASDLRGGAGLCVACLKVDGQSSIYNPHYIDRGYEKIEDLFCSLGADVRRTDK